MEKEKITETTKTVVKKDKKGNLHTYIVKTIYKNGKITKQYETLVR